LVAPLSWVAARVDSTQPLVSSPAAVGAELAVLPNGDLHAAEAAVDLERWRLGNVLQGAKDIRWERLDVMPEVFSNATMPAKCLGCDWRYRCGGVDASLLLLEEAAGQGPAGNSAGGAPAALVEGTGRMPVPRLDLYCAPRKQLFEGISWDSTEAAATGQAGAGRERIELREDGLEFTPVHEPTSPSIHQSTNPPIH